MRLVLSLTSTPMRIGRIEPTIRSLLAQSYSFDALYLWLPRALARTGECLDEAHPVLHRLRQADPRIRITIREEDIGPATKLLPTLEAETGPDTLIFYCDDDIGYGPEMLAWLVECAFHWPNAAVGVSLIDLDPTRQNTTATGQTYFAFQSAGQHGQEAGIIEGYGGVLVRRDFFGPRFPSLFPPLGPEFLSAAREKQVLHSSLSDDLVISTYLRQRGVRLLNVRLPGCDRSTLTIFEHGKKADALQRQSEDGGPFGNIVRYSRAISQVKTSVARVVEEENRVMSAVSSIPRH